MCSFTLLLKNFPWLPVYWITTNFLMCNLKLSTDTVRQRETKLCIFSQCFSNFNTYMHDLIDKMWFWFSSPGLILFRTGPKQNLRWLELREQRRALSIKSLGVRERGGRRKKQKKSQWSAPMENRSKRWTSPERFPRDFPSKCDILSDRTMGLSIWLARYGLHFSLSRCFIPSLKLIAWNHLSLFDQY